MIDENSSRYFQGSVGVINGFLDDFSIELSQRSTVKCHKLWYVRLFLLLSQIVNQCA